MATAISEQIAVIVRSRLAAISTGSGYETTISGGAIRPTKLGGFQPKDYQVVVTQGTQEQIPELSHPGNPPAVAWNLPFNVSAILRPSDELNTAMDTLRNEFAADVVKALNTGSAWWTFGGLAINSTIGAITSFEPAEGSSGGFNIILNVIFRTDENNPFNGRA